jgi:hypothetical protein
VIALLKWPKIIKARTSAVLDSLSSSQQMPSQYLELANGHFRSHPNLSIAHCHPVIRLYIILAVVRILNKLQTNKQLNNCFIIFELLALLHQRIYKSLLRHTTGPHLTVQIFGDDCNKSKFDSGGN